MKKVIITLSITAALLTACNNSEKMEAEKYVDDLEDLIEDANENSKDATIHDWQKIEAEYNEALANIEARKDYLSDEASEDFNEVKQDFKDLKKKYKAKIDNTQAMANKKMDKIENWMDKKSENIDENTDDLQEEWDEMTDDVKDGWDDFTDETKDRWNNLEAKFKDWVEK